MIKIACLFILSFMLSSAYASDSVAVALCGALISKQGGPCSAGPSSKSSPFPKAPEVAGFAVSGFVPSKDNFAEATVLFGSAMKWSTGAGSVSLAEDKICYRDSTASRPTFLVLAANHELSRNKIDSYRLIGGNVAFADKCVTSKLAPIEVANGIRIGMSVAELESILGHASEVRDNTFLYAWLVDDGEKYVCVGGESPQFASKMMNLAAHFDNGYLDWVEVQVPSEAFC